MEKYWLISILLLKEFNLDKSLKKDFTIVRLLFGWTCVSAQNKNEITEIQV